MAGDLRNWGFFGVVKGLRRLSYCFTSCVIGWTQLTEVWLILVWTVRQKGLGHVAVQGEPLPMIVPLGLAQQ